jgi:hypothetical protein
MALFLRQKYTFRTFRAIKYETTSFEHAGQNLWLDRGNAKSSETKYELCRNSVTKTESEYLKCLEPLRVCNGWNKNNRLDFYNIPSNKTMLQVSYIILFIYALSILLIFFMVSV